MSYTSTDISNLALSQLGDKQGITGFPPTDNTAAARMCALHYPKALSELLREVDWPFARRFAALALVETADDQDWASEWGYAYRYPADCARVLNILSGDRSQAEPIPYSLSSDSVGRLIFTDQSEPAISYTAELTDTTLFASDFCEALAARLAARLAIPITGKAEWRAEAAREAARLVGIAKASAFNERGREASLDGGSVRARG